MQVIWLHGPVVVYVGHWKLAWNLHTTMNSFGLLMKHAFPCSTVDQQLDTSVTPSSLKFQWVKNTVNTVRTEHEFLQYATSCKQSMPRPRY